MKRTFRIIIVVFLILVLLGALAGGIFIRYTSRKALPDYSQDIELPAEISDVRVFRDSTAMPHIYAENEQDLYLATGYLMAQDRMWQMDLLRRLTEGRLSEVLGKRLADVDQLFRALQFSQKSAMVLDSSSTEVMENLEAFSKGVNLYLEKNRGKLPPEFSILGYEPEEWKPLHSANLIGYMAWGLTMAWSMEVNLYKIGNAVGYEYYNELIPDLDYQNEVIFPGFMEKHAVEFVSALNEIDKTIADLGLEVFQGSNNWAVAGWKSANGHAMMANDMHLELNAPGIWYQAHMVVPGDLDVSGVVLPGQPYVICGHNSDVAWGMTNVMLDDMDFYLETINPEDSLSYKFNGEWRKMKVKKEKILTSEGDTLIRYNLFTHRGPVISEFKGIKGKVVSMRWIGNEYSNEMQSVYLFNRMKNWQDFREAAKTFISISQNIVYADKEGNIGLQTAAGIPLRAGEGIFIVPGDTSLYDWQGLLPFEDLPFSYNPQSGYVASANNRTIGDEYPWYISRWFDLPNRYERIVEGLSSKEKISLEDFREIQADQQSAWAEKLVPFFLNLMKDRIDPDNKRLDKAFNLLSSWDYKMEKDSVAPLIFEQFYIEFGELMCKDELGEELYGKLIDQDLLLAYLMERIRNTGTSVWFDNVNTKDVTEGPSDLAVMALENTVDSLSERIGGDMNEWKWGDVHTLTLEHPLGSVNVLNKAFNLNKGPYPVGGSYHTVSPYSYPFNDLFHANHGSSHRHIYVCGDWDQSLTILPTGISGIPASPFYCSMTDDYLNYRYKKDAFSKNEVQKNAMFSIIIKKSEKGEE